MEKYIDIPANINNTPVTNHIDWCYPEIYDKDNLGKLTISLMHTRASKDITISYESDRDGWVISRDNTELAFIENDWEEDEFGDSV